MAYRFADFTLDTERFQLRRGAEPIPLEPKVLSLLIHLVEAAPRTIAKAELLDAVWRDVAVSDGSLVRAVSLARQALGDRTREEKILLTVRGRGYRIGVPVSRADPEPATRSTGEVFIGREKVLAEVRGVLSGAIEGRGQILLLAGEPGIGKTRLAEVIADEARDRGFQVLWGRCWEGEGGPAFWPWVQILRAVVGRRDANSLAEELGAGGADIAEIVPAVRDTLPELPTATALEPEQARFRLFNSVTRFLQSASRRVPMLLLLDDLQAGDPSSLKLLEFAASQLAETRIVVIGAYRDTEARTGSDLARTLAELHRTGRSTRRIELGRFTAAEVREYIGAVEKRLSSDRLVDLVHGKTDGNPLFVREVVRWLGSQGRTDVGADAVGIPPTLRQVIESRLSGVSSECRRLLNIASVVGREFGIQLVARVARRLEQAVLEALNEPKTLHLIEEARGVPGGFRFTHVLLRDVLYDDLPDGRRLALHRQVGEALETIYADHPEAPLAELSHHFREAAVAGDAARAIQYAQRAGQRAQTTLAFEEAVNLFRGALGLCNRPGAIAPDARGQLMIALGQAQLAADLWRSAEVARSLADGELLGATAWTIGRRRIGGYGFVVEERLRLVQEAAATLGPGDGALRARLLAQLSEELHWADSPEMAEQLSREALSMARRVGDVRALAAAMAARHEMNTGRLDLDDHRSVMDEMIRDAADAEDLAIRTLGLSIEIEALIEDGEGAALDRRLEEWSRLAAELDDPRHLGLVAQTRAVRAIWRGELDAAEDLARKAVALASPTDPELAGLKFMIQLVTLRRLQGRLDEIVHAVAEGAERLPAIQLFACGQVMIHDQLGQRAEAARRFEELAADDFAGLRRDFHFGLNLALLAEACAHLGDAERGVLLYGLLEPWAGRYIQISGFAAAGCGSRYLGLLATLLERFDDAERHFARALEVERRMQAPPAEAHALHDFARMLLARDASGDRERARDYAAASLKVAKEMGLRGLESQLRAIGAPAAV